MCVYVARMLLILPNNIFQEENVLSIGFSAAVENVYPRPKSATVGQIVKTAQMKPIFAKVNYILHIIYRYKSYRNI